MSYTARTLIGCQLEHGQIFKKLAVKTSSHDHPPEVKFHPQTGAKLWTEAEYCILMPVDEGYERGCDLSGVEPREELGGLFLFYDRSGWGEGSERYLLGGMAVEADVDDGGRKGGNFRAIKDAKTFAEEVEKIRVSVEALLKPHKLWRADRFGLWTVCYSGI